MNNALQEFARTQLKEMLAQCTEDQRVLFKRMYSRHTKQLGNGALVYDLSLDINAVVDEMIEDKLDWAMQQCQRTLSSNN